MRVKCTLPLPKTKARNNPRKGDKRLTRYSSGAGNIGDPGVKAPPTGRVDQDVVPSEAYRPSTEADFHTGRGGLGNEHAAGKGGHAPLSETAGHTGTPISFADKLKHKIFGNKK